MKCNARYRLLDEWLKVNRVNLVVDIEAAQYIGKPQGTATPLRPDLDERARLFLPEQQLVKREIEGILVGWHTLVCIAHRAVLNGLEMASG